MVDSKPEGSGAAYLGGLMSKDDASLMLGLEREKEGAIFAGTSKPQQENPIQQGSGVRKSTFPL